MSSPFLGTKECLDPGHIHFFHLSNYVGVFQVIMKTENEATENDTENAAEEFEIKEENEEKVDAPVNDSNIVMEESTETMDEKEEEMIGDSEKDKEDAEVNNDDKKSDIGIVTDAAESTTNNDNEKADIGIVTDAAESTTNNDDEKADIGIVTDAAESTTKKPTPKARRGGMAVRGQRARRGKKN